jgi:Branched-chain amino acid transport protein (AzlD)
VNAAWPTIALLALGTIAIKAAGPVAFGSRQLPPRLAGVIVLLAPALLAALVAVETFGGPPHELVLSARVVGVAAAGAATLLRLPLGIVVVVAAAATALARALS